MKTNYFIIFAALLLVSCVMFGCGKNNQGSVYGTVTDFATGDPVVNANVRLNPRGETTLTGYDGTFQFYDLADGSYSLSLSKNGYMDLDDDYVIKIENGKSVRRDVQIRNNMILVYGIVTNQYDDSEPGVEVEIYWYDNEQEVQVCAATSANDGSYRVSFDHANPTDTYYVYAHIFKTYMHNGTLVGYPYSSAKMYFNVSHEQEFNINPIIGRH